MRQLNSIWLKACFFVSIVFVLQSCASTGLTEKKAKDASNYNAQLGSNYLQRGDLKLARDKLEKALTQDPNNALAHATYGQLQYRIDNTEQARVHFKKAIELEPDKAVHRNSYGIFLCQVEDYDEAEKQFKSAATNPYYDTPEFAYDNAGLCMLQASRLTEAGNFLRKALEINPRFANAYLHMAELLHKRQRMTVATAYYERYLAYGRDTAESLFLGMQIKRDSGDLASAEQYAGRLLNEFPTSREAGEYLTRPIQ